MQEFPEDVTLSDSLRASSRARGLGFLGRRGWGWGEGKERKKTLSPRAFSQASYTIKKNILVSCLAFNGNCSTEVN